MNYHLLTVLRVLDLGKHIVDKQISTGSMKKDFECRRTSVSVYLNLSVNNALFTDDGGGEYEANVSLDKILMSG